MRQQLARQQQKLVDAGRQRKLLRIALALEDPAQAPYVVALAMEQVQLWRKSQICSSDYIEAWEGLLEQPREAARVLRDPSPHAAQLRQNSPFVAVVRGRLLPLRLRSFTH